MSSHNQSRGIASLVCPLLRSKSRRVRFRCTAKDNDTLFDTAYRLLQMFGAKKGVFQTMRNHVINSILFSEDSFEIAHQFIELRSLSPKGFWTGSRMFKESSVQDAELLGEMFAKLGKETLAPGPDALVQIDITD